MALEESSYAEEHQRRLAAEAQIVALRKELEEVRGQSMACESSLVQNEKMASLGVLTAGIAHEINNPVGYIISNVSTLGDYLPDMQQLLKDMRNLMEDIPVDSPLAKQRDTLAERAEESDMDYVMQDTTSLLKETLEGAQRVLGIVRGLKDYAHADDEAFELASVNDCLQATLSLVNNELKYSCQIETSFAELPDCHINTGRLGQVFLNLLVNAGHAVGEKGLIQLRTELVKDNIVVEVQDNGCGMSEEVQAQIFEAFYTTKAKGEGTGLGLSISRGIVEEHGGEICVRSQVGLGTTFSIKLPLPETLGNQGV